MKEIVIIMLKYVILAGFFALVPVETQVEIFFPGANPNIRRRGRPEPQVPESESLSLGNSLTSIDEFTSYFNVSLPINDPFKPNFTITTRTGGGPIGDDANAVQSLMQAVCAPEMTTVTLDLPQQKGVSFFPTCVRVERCGGCCILSHHSCQPTSIKKIKTKVVKIEEEAVTRRRRRTRNAPSKYIALEVEAHQACECQCRLQENECDLAVQRYNRHRCDCECIDTNKEKTCLSRPQHFWNPDSCQCLCRTTIDCSTGQNFDHETCSCR